MKTIKSLGLLLLALLSYGAYAQNYTFLGTFAGASNGTTATNSTGIGYNALNFNTTTNNVAVGSNALSVTGVYGTEYGSYNTAVGVDALKSNKTGRYNCALGEQTLTNNSKGYYNIGIGRRVMELNELGDNNVVVGSGALVNINGADGTCDGNVALGTAVGQYIGQGSGNVFIGNKAAAGLTGTVNDRLYIDNSGSFTPLIYGQFDTRNLRFYVNNSASSNLEITSGTTGANGTSGLKFTNLKNTNNAITNPSSPAKVLSVNSTGDVILVNDNGGGITSSCTTNGNIPMTSGAGTSLGCSQMADYGTTIAINSAGPFTYSSLSGFQLGTTVPPSTGTFRLDVNGVTRSVAYFASSDSKFKKDVKPIENAMAEVQKLSGKTYHWKKEAFQDMDFSDQLQFGLIAQELGEVFPSLVAKSDKGDYSINYIGLIPVLIEALKEQQTQIDELKNQISENFKQDNSALLDYGNTKIIAVSPNPSNDVMVVSLNIEKSVSTAKLLVHDINGTLLSSLNIGERDNNISKTLQKDNFGKGIFVVSLVVNGKSIDTKKVVFN